MAYLLLNAAASFRWQPRRDILRELAERFRVEALLREAAAVDAAERFLCLVPTERRVRWLKRQFFRWVAEFHAGKSSPEPTLFTLAGFLWSCFSRLFPPGRYIVLSDAHQLALFEEAAHRAPLMFYRRQAPALPPALLEQLAGVIRGLRRDGVTAAVLEERLEEAQQRADPAVDITRLRDIVALAQAYEALLGEEFVDEPRAWELVTHALLQRGSAAFRQLFPEAELLLLEGFSEFRSPELAFLEALARQELPVVISIDYSPENGPLFGNFQEVVERLRDAGYQSFSTDPPILMTEQTPPEQRVFLPLGAYLRRWLFNTEREIRHPGFSAVVTIVECRDREQEVLLIARLVKDLLCRRGYHPREIAVVMRRPEQYSALFREIFALYGIPANVTDRFWLVQSPVVIAALGLLGLPLNGFRRIDLERLVYNPYVRLLGADGRPIDGVNLITVARRRRILGGHRFGGAQGWIRQLEEACVFLQQQLQLLEADPYSDPLEQEQVRQELMACRRALEDFEALRQRLTWDQRYYTPTEFLQLLRRDIVLEMGIYEAIGEAYAQLRQQRWRSDAEWLAVLEQIERDARALTRLMELTEEFAAIFQRRWGQQPRPLAEYVERFTTALRAERYQVREKPGAGVTITSIEQTRGIPFRVLILCGALDGEFPLPYRTEHLLGYEIPQAEERHRRAERMLFYQFLTNHPEALEQQQQQLYITYPLMQGDEQVVRSPFVDELLKVTSLQDDGCLINASELLKWFHGGNAEEGNAYFHSQYARIPWIAVQGTASEFIALMWERAEELTTLEDGAYPLLIPQPWEPDAAQYPLYLAPEQEERYRHRVGRYFSATELELYRRCPYRYFAAHVLGLRPLEVAPLELSPLERGLLLHRIVYRFFRERQEKGEQIASSVRGELPPLQSAPLDEGGQELYRRLREIAAEELQRVRFEHPWFALEAEALLGTEDRQGLLWFWLLQEYKRWREYECHGDRRPAFVPVAFELGFGMHPGMVEPVPLTEDVGLRGRIDRIELSMTAEGKALVGIADYKSSALHRQASLLDCQRGFHLQLPLYLWAARQILAREYGLQTEYGFAAFYALRPHRRLGGAEAEESERCVISCWDRRVRIDDIVEAARAYAQDAVEKIRRRLFPVAPYRGTFCRSCPYKALCRVSQLQSGEGI